MSAPRQKEAAQRELAEFFPPDPDGAKPIAYLWARTVRCESPDCGAEIPLARSFWLSKKRNRRRALRHRVARPAGATPTVEFEIVEPHSAPEVPTGTVRRANARCPCCDTVLPPERVRAQLAAQRGGADIRFDAQRNRVGGARLLAVVTLRPGEQGRHYRLARERDYQAVWQAMQRLAQVATTRLDNGLGPIPDEPPPPVGTLGFRVQRYGMLQWGDLFTARQKLAIITLRDIIVRVAMQRAATEEVAGLALSRFSDISNALCRWESSKTQVRNLFTRQAVPIVWDFGEADLFGDQAGDYAVTLETMARVIDRLSSLRSVGRVQLADACASPLPDGATTVWFTDPPYYDAVPHHD